MKNNNDSLVTVIIPTFSRPMYIERAIASVLNQTYKNIELIVVDDNEPTSPYRKEMQTIMQKYNKNKNVHYIQHERNLNGAAARNTGIDNSSGKYITFLDDDDVFFPKRVELLVNKIEKSDCDAIYSSCIVARNNKIENIINANKNGNLQLDMLLINSVYGTGSNLFFTAESLKNIKGFDVSFTRLQDLEVMVRFFEKYKIENINEFLVIKNIDDRINEPNVTKSIDCRIKFLDTFKDIIDKYNLNEKNTIYKTNILDLFRNAYKGTKKDLNRVKQLKKKYGIKFNIKDFFKLLAYFLNSKIRIKKLFDKLFLIIKNAKIDSSLKDEIKKLNKV